jgi:hypothetical protein
MTATSLHDRTGAISQQRSINARSAFKCAMKISSVATWNNCLEKDMSSKLVPREKQNNALHLHLQIHALKNPPGKTSHTSKTTASAGHGWGEKVPTGQI